MNWWNGITKEDKELDKNHTSFQITSEMKRLWCHVIWTTDKQQRVLHPGLRKKLFPYMTEYCAYKDIKLDCLNGHAEHVHCLFPYTFDTDLAKNIYLIQKETENWIKKHKFIEGDEEFVWNRNFIALSVGQSSIEALRTYIKAQEVIHKKKTYRQEFTEIVEKYGFKR
jgi:putative transposase